ncbi:MAG TPA: hypothetical protein EYO00_04940 [Gammaproteobacteria bacterium]|jgi:hypothetical protein|nr:hypothetical protein [Gammaproteobacteria bacterium]HIF86008.1 hypothetical protein [Gammaproteobacteria bacterium]HIL61928.1 hypothetical protein [Porticoccaceae bacterium]HIN89729.1 hypothetical protein [Porticoccaceae bacterium]
MNQASDPSGDESPATEKAAELLSQQQAILRKIGRARIRLLVCCWTLPVYIIGIWILLGNGRTIDTFMFIYMGLFAGFALDMSLRRCPRCHQQFFVKSILLNLITHRCVHCSSAISAEYQGNAPVDQDEQN